MSVIRTAFFFPPTVIPLLAASYCPYSPSWKALCSTESNPTILVARWYSVIPIKVVVPHRPNQSSKQLLIVLFLPHCLRTPQLWNSNIQADIVARLNRNTGHASISPHKAMFPVHSIAFLTSSKPGFCRTIKCAPAPPIQSSDVPAAERIPGLTSQSQHHIDNIGFWVRLCVAKISYSSVVDSPSFYGDKKQRAF
ncbi:hypothetical protein B0H14DRAFT_2590098 [Mycena olivaceomarginata]|nr:hypothetical protein B0H14DRAFT_2590098 [Mycena olivaceomarginata]